MHVCVLWTLFLGEKSNNSVFWQQLKVNCNIEANLAS